MLLVEAIVEDIVEMVQRFYATSLFSLVSAIL